MVTIAVVITLVQLLLQKKDNYLVPCVMYSKNKKTETVIQSNKELEIILAQPTKKIFGLLQI